MPIKESTIRLKLIGSNDVSSGVAQYGRELRANMEALRRATKVEAETVAGNRPQAEIDAVIEKRIAAQKRLDDSIKASEDVRNQTTWDAQRQAVDRAVKYNTTAFNKAAADGLITNEQAEKANRAILVQSQNEKEKITRGELAELDAAHKQNYARNKKETAEKVAIHKDAVKEEKEISKEIMQGIEFRGLQEVKAEKAAAKEKIRIAKETAKAQQEDTVKGIAGLGGKMVLGHALGMTAGMAANDPQAGSIVGSIATASMFGGPVTGAAVAAMEVSGLAYQAYRENVRAAAKGNIEFSNSIRTLAKSWSAASVSLISQNNFGKVISDQILQAEASVMKLNATITNTLLEGPSASDRMARFFTGRSGFNTGLVMAERQRDMQQKEADQDRADRQVEYENKLKSERKVFGVTEQLNQTQGMRPGLTKDRAQLDLQVKAENTAQDELFKEQKRQADLSVQRTTENYAKLFHDANKLYPMTKEGAAQQNQAIADAEKARTELEKAKEAQSNLTGQQAFERDKSASNQRGRSIELDLKYFLATQALSDQAQDATIASQKTGYAREEELHKAHLQRMERDMQLVENDSRAPAWKKFLQDDAAARNTDKGVILNQKMALLDVNAALAVQKALVSDLKTLSATDKQTNDIQNAQYLVSAEQAIVDKKLAGREITEQEAGIQRAMIADRRLAADAEGEAAMKKAAAARQEVVNTQRITAERLVQADLADRIAVAQGRMTQEEMNIRAALRKYGEKEAAANPAVAAEIKATQAEADKARRSEKYQSPLKQFENETKDILKSLADGTIDKERARHLLQVNANQVNQQPTGEFTSMSSRWRDIQGAILRPEDDTMKLTLEELKQLRNDLNELRAMGIPIRG